MPRNLEDVVNNLQQPGAPRFTFSISPTGDVDSYVNPPHPRDEIVAASNGGWYCAFPFVREWMRYGVREEDENTWPCFVYEDNGNWSFGCTAKNDASNNSVRYYVWVYARITDPVNMAELRLIKVWEGYFGAQYQQPLRGRGHDEVLQSLSHDIMSKKYRLLFAVQQEHKPLFLGSEDLPPPPAGHT